MSPVVKPDCSNLTAGIKISLHFSRILLLFDNDDLQCSNGKAQIAACMLHYALLQGNIQDLQLALCKLYYTSFHRRSGDLHCAS